MKDINELFIRILLSGVIYILLTLPHITFIYFGVGMRYNTPSILICGIGSAIIVYILRIGKNK